MDEKKRRCLKCGKLFESIGPGNRICKPCRWSNDKLHITEDQVHKQRGVARRNSNIISDIPDSAWGETD